MNKTILSVLLLTIFLSAQALARSHKRHLQAMIKPIDRPELKQFESGEIKWDELPEVIKSDYEVLKKEFYQEKIPWETLPSDIRGDLNLKTSYEKKDENFKLYNSYRDKTFYDANNNFGHAVQVLEWRKGLKNYHDLFYGIKTENYIMAEAVQMRQLDMYSMSPGAEKK